MKSITVYFENDEFRKLKEGKGNLSWHDFIWKYCLKINIPKKDDE